MVSFFFATREAAAMGKDQRKHERYPVSYEARVKRIEKSLDPAAQDRFTARVADISRGGVCIELKELVYPKERLRVVVEKQAAGFGLDVATVVRWTEKITGGYRAGMQFTEVRKLSIGQAGPAATSQRPAQESPQASREQA